MIRRKQRFRVLAANNEVIDGIRETATALKRGQLLVSGACVNTIKEFGMYAWNEKKPEDTVIKEHDHAMDAMRYFVHTMRIADIKLRKKAG